MDFYKILSELVSTSKYKYSDSITIEVRGDFDFRFEKQSDHIRIAFTGSKKVFITTKMVRLSFSVSGVKLYPEKYIVEIDGWTDVECKY